MTTEVKLWHSLIIFAIMGSIIGWAIAFFSGQGTEAQSKYSGWGAGIGLATGLLFWGQARARRSLNDKARS